MRWCDRVLSRHCHKRKDHGNGLVTHLHAADIGNQALIHTGSKYLGNHPLAGKNIRLLCAPHGKHAMLRKLFADEIPDKS